MRKFILVGLAALAMAAPSWSKPALAAGDGVALPHVDWSFNGVFGKWDRKQLARGWEVYSGVCAACHSLRLVAYRNLIEIGVPESKIKEYMATKEVDGDPDDTGEITKRKPNLADRIMGPNYRNEQAARAANGTALPPDLSLMTKARAGAADYVHALMIGYGDAPKTMKDDKGKDVEFKVESGLYYNKYFPGHKIAMAKPLNDDGVTYTDGTKATVAQMATDVAAFLTWAAEPEMEDRKRLGIKALLFLLLCAGFFYAIKRKVWADLKH
ncbi:MAG: cytochrome c1 [Alphaproteobacteria bacterium]